MKNKMNLSLEFSKVLWDRQYKFRNFQNFSYESKIIQSYFDSSESMFSLVRDSKNQSSKLCFSKDGNFVAEDSSIWKLNDDYLFDNSSKVMNIENFYNVHAIVFNKDSSKVLVGGSVNKYHVDFKILIYDLEKKVKSNLSEDRLMSYDISSSCINSNLFVLSCIMNGLLLKDLREKKFEKLEKETMGRTYVQHHPFKEHNLLVSTDSKNGVYIFDIRNRKRIFKYKTLFNNECNETYARYNEKGDNIFLIRTFSSPLLYHVDQSYPIYNFDEISYCNYSPLLFHFYKNCCFAGPNEKLVVTPSDDNNVYIWQIPKKLDEDDEKKSVIKTISSAKYVLKNSSKTFSVAYNYKRSVLACSGKEESIKFWSVFPFYSKSDPKRDYSQQLDFINENFDFDYYPESTIAADLHYFITYFSFSFPRPPKINNTSFNEDCNHDYFSFNLENFQIQFTEDFLNEFKQNLSINYIKSFIHNYIIYKRKKYFDYAERLEKSLNKNISFLERIFKDGYLSLLSELKKVFYTKLLIIKSLKFIKIQLTKLEDLIEKIIHSKNEKSDTKNDENLENLAKIKIILKSMVIDLEIIVLENKKLFKNPIELAKKLLHFYSNSNLNIEILLGGNIHEIINSLNEKKMIENFEKMNAIDSKEKVFHDEIKKERDLKLFNDDLNKSLENLKNVLESKKEMKNDYCLISIDNIDFTEV